MGYKRASIYGAQDPQLVVAGRQACRRQPEPGGLQQGQRQAEQCRELLDAFL
jgi:hypothetical protein